MVSLLQAIWSAISQFVGFRPSMGGSVIRTQRGGGVVGRVWLVSVEGVRMFAVGGLERKREDIGWRRRVVVDRRRVVRRCIGAFDVERGNFFRGLLGMVVKLVYIYDGARKWRELLRRVELRFGREIVYASAVLSIFKIIGIACRDIERIGSLIGRTSPIGRDALGSLLCAHLQPLFLEKV